MELAIFLKTYARPTLAAALQGVKMHHISNVHLNMSCAGLPSLPLRMDRETLESIGQTIQESGLNVVGLSGTFNMIHPDLTERTRGLHALETLARSCPTLKTRVITLCTGTRDPQNMWGYHRDNNTKQAWDDLLRTMERALVIAERNNVTIAFEPELGNVINSAEKARRLLDHFRANRLKVVIDGANLIRLDQVGNMESILDEAFALLGKDIILAHAKDFSVSSNSFVAAGQGSFAFSHYLELLQKSGFSGPLILHGLMEEEVTASTQFLQNLMEGPKL